MIRRPMKERPREAKLRTRRGAEFLKCDTYAIKILRHSVHLLQRGKVITALRNSTVLQITRMTRYPFTTLANTKAHLRSSNYKRCVERGRTYIRYTRVAKRRTSWYFCFVLNDSWDRFRISVFSVIRFLSANYYTWQLSERLVMFSFSTRHRLITLVTIIWEATIEWRTTDIIFQSRELWQHQRHRNDGIVMGNGTVLIECKIYERFLLPPCRRLSFSFP